jgi:glutaconate CoA-transferase subunit A
MRPDSGSRPSKLMSEAQAVSRFVSDGDTVYAGFTHVSFALTFEIIRQGLQNLKVVGASNTLSGNFLALAGNCNRIETGYMGGALYNGPVGEMMRDGRIRYEDYSNLTITLRFMAGALGMPFIPSNTFLGTDYLTTGLEHEFDLRDDRIDEDGNTHPRLHVIDSPFDGKPIALLSAIQPDVALIHVQRADEIGNIQAWGPLADTKWAVGASRHIIATAEEIVPTSVIKSQPELTIAPAFRVNAVIHVPWGSHPGPLSGRLMRDRTFFELVGNPFTSWENAESFIADWIMAPKSRAEYVAQYIDRFGEDMLEQQRVTQPLLPEQPAEQGWR